MSARQFTTDVDTNRLLAITNQKHSILNKLLLSKCSSHELRRSEEVGQNRRPDPEDVHPPDLCTYGVSARMPSMREDGNDIGRLAAAWLELMGLKV